MPTEWFYSKSGQQLGPIPSEQLKQLATAGQLQPSDLVWKDGMGQWVESRKIKGLFPAQPMSSPQGPPNSPQPEATPPQWFFSNAGQQRGPVSAEQLKQLAGEGRLLPSDLVWKDGMGQWAEAKNIEWLFPSPTRITQLPPLLPPDAIAGPPPMSAAAPAALAVPSSPQTPTHAAVFQPPSHAEPSATVESQPFDFLDSSSTNTPHRSPRSFKKQPRKKTSLPLWLRIVMIVCASMILLYGGLRGWMESGGGSGVTNSRPTQTTGGPSDQTAMPPGGGADGTPVNPGYGRMLKVLVNTGPERNPASSWLHSVRCIATEDSLILDFKVEG